MHRYAEWIVRHRVLVLAIALLATLALGAQLRNLNVIVDADELLPRHHPFVEVTERVQEVFGNRYTVAIGIGANSGTVFTPEILGKVLQVTDALVATPGVTPGNLQSLAAPRAKDIAGDGEGLIVSRLLDHIPADPAAAEAIRVRLAANPAYEDILVSRDGRTAAIYVEFEKNPAGFAEVMRKVDAAVDPVRDASVSIAIAGQPVFLAALETFSKRMAFLLPVAILLIGLIHLEAFRTIQGLVLPLLTAVLAVVWSLGLMTLGGVHLDPFNNVTPILILAVAAGHAVQVLKRYYEEYARLRIEDGMEARPASHRAVVASLVRVGPVMIAAGLIASLSFMSLAVFEIQSIRSFGIFAGIGILSIVVVEMTFTPALRAMLPPPSRIEVYAEQKKTPWDRLAGIFAGLVSTPGGRRRILAGWGIAALLLAAGAAQIHIDNSLRGFFAQDLRERREDLRLNTALAGTNTFYVLVEGKTDDAIKDPAVLEAMETTQAFLARQPEIGHTLSIVDLLKQINRGLNGGAASAAVLPRDADLISQYLLLYSMSGEPGDFDGLVDYPYRNAIIQAFVKTDSSAFVARLDSALAPVIAASFPPSVEVRLGGSITTPTAMNEVMVSGKLKNIAQISAVVFVVSLLLFRSPALSGLILVPLAATTLAVFGIMGWFGIPLQIATATVSALAVGIGADYAIYLTYRLREELGSGVAESQAVATTFASAGKAIMFVATAVAGGYAVLMASWGFNIHFWLGLLISMAMAVAAFSTLTLFAATLLILRPKVVFADARHAAAPVEPPIGASESRPPVTLAALAALCFLLLPPGQARAEAVDAAALMAESLKVTKPERSTAVGEFILTNRSGQSRIREVTSVTELQPDGVNNKRVVRFSAPADVKGTAVLTIEGEDEDSIWVYLPALKKVRRLTASQKKDAFVGTDFSYGDVLGHPVEDWDHRLLRSETVNGVPTQVIESTPRDPAVVANTGYSRRINWLRADDAVPVKTEYYGPQGALLKVYTADDIQLVDPQHKRFQAMRQTMRNVATGHSTVIAYSSFRTDLPVPDTQFVPRTLERPF